MVESLGERYRKLREKKEFSITKLAKILSCNPKTISFYENDTREMPRDVIIKYADYFGVSTDFLLGRTNDPDPHPTAVDDLNLSPEAISLIKKYAKTTRYKNRSVLDCLLSHEKFDTIISSVAGMVYFDIRAKSGTFDLSRKTGVNYFAVLQGLVQDEYKDAIGKMISCFGTGSGIVGGRSIVEYEAFLAKKAFDVILESLTNEIINRPKRGGNRNVKA